MIHNLGQPHQKPQPKSGNGIENPRSKEKLSLILLCDNNDELSQAFYVVQHLAATPKGPTPENKKWN
jgi:hypothetical protein